MNNNRTQIANRRAFQAINGLNALPMLEFVCWELLLRRQLNMFKFLRFVIPAKAGIQWRTPVSRWGEGMPSPFAGTTGLLEVPCWARLRAH